MYKPNPVIKPQDDLFRPKLESFINTRHALCVLSKQIDWEGLTDSLGKYYKTETTVGRPGEPIRLMAGLLLLKEIHGLSDESLCEHWAENPYYQYFTGEEFFQHRKPIEPPSISNFRSRIGKAGLERILQETIKVALKSGALKPQDMKIITVDTTVQEKAIRYPTDVYLCHKARLEIVKDGKDLGINLRQNYNRKSNNSRLQSSRMTAARKKSKAIKFAKEVRNYLGRVLREIDRKLPLIEAKADKSQTLRMAKFKESVRKGWIIFRQFYNREAKERLYSWHATETECIGKGKIAKPFEFGCKVSLVVSNKSNFILSSEALHGKPYDGHSLAGALSSVRALTGATITEVHVDRGYRGHKIEDKGLRVIKSGTRSGITRAVKARMKRRNAIEPIIGHCKHDRKIGSRNFLRGKVGDQMNALAIAIGFNLRKLLRSFFCNFGIRAIFANFAAVFHIINETLLNSREYSDLRT